MSKILFIDTETNGLPRDFRGAYNDTTNWPRLVQIAWLLADEDGKTLAEKSYIIKPDGWVIGGEVSNIHGITTERAHKEGIPLQGVIDALEVDLIGVKYVVCHNVNFDRPVLACEYCRVAQQIQSDAWSNSVIYPTAKHFCTMEMTTNILKIPGKIKDTYKWPKLDELYKYLFGKDVPGRDRYHDALFDVRATAQCFFKIKAIKQGAAPNKSGYGYQESVFQETPGGWMLQEGEEMYNNHLAVWEHFNKK